MLVVALPSAQASQIAGTSFEQNPQTWRVGPSPSANGTALRVHLRGDTFTLKSMHWRTGAQHVSGAWQLNIVTEDYASGLSAVPASTVMTMLPNAWNTWTLASPVLLTDCHHCVRRLEIIPVGGAEMDFINIGGGASGYIDTQIGSVYGRPPYAEADLVNPAPGPQPSVAATFVMELTGEDPFATAACAGDAGRVLGSPYDTVDLVEIPDGVVGTQIARMVDLDRFTRSNALIDFRAPLTDVTATEVWLELSGGISAPMKVRLQPHVGSWYVMLPTAFMVATRESGGTFTVGIRPVGGSVKWPRLSTSRADAGECDPLVRATWAGSLAHAPNQVDSDFMFLFRPCEAVRLFQDSDGDGFGDPLTHVDSCFHEVTGFVRDASDCDDSSRLRRPDAGEQCNNVDDDCDGRVDAQDPKLQLTVCELTKGICSQTRRTPQSCVGGAWKECTAAAYPQPYEPVEATCDGLDNDCDGLIDQSDLDVVAPACEHQSGVCAGASHPRTSCTSAGWLRCEAQDYGAAYQADETRCDQLDNDCDGEIDEGCARLEAPPAILGTAPARCSVTGTTSIALVLLPVIAFRRRTRERASAGPFPAKCAAT